MGVNDKGKILGLKKDYETLKKSDRDGFELHLRAIISQAYGQHFAAQRIEIFFPHVNKEEICVLKIKKGRTPIYTMTTDKNCGARQEKFYIRMGNSCREIEKPSDIVIYHSDRPQVVLFEAKYAKTLGGLQKSCAEALQQIEDRQYAKEFKEDYDSVLCYGIAFYKKRCLVRINRKRPHE